jgi:hypothetical protein
MLRVGASFASGLRDWRIFGIDVDRLIAVLVALLKGKATPSQSPQITVEQNQNYCTQRQRCRTGFFIKKNPTSQIQAGHSYF